MHVYKFRNCLLNTFERSVIKGDQCLELTTRTFDVLQFLIENAGKVVTKDELLGNVWNGSFVEESNLPVHISRLRRSLGESKYNRFIETVQGTGYRFVAPVKEVDAKTWRVATTSFASSSPPRLVRDNHNINSIAVVPFKNEGRYAEDGYLADGITESLINRFSHIP